MDPGVPDRLGMTPGTQSVIVVVRPDGSPISGAEVVRAGTWDTIGRTDDAGGVPYTSDSLEGERILARASGYAPEFAWIDRPVPVRTTIELRPEWILKGQVVDRSGYPAGRGLTVLAVGQHDPLLYADVRAASAGRGPLCSAVTGDEGAFALMGLHPGKGYRVHAGGRGFCSADPFSRAVFERDRGYTHIVTVSPVYGVRIDIRDRATGEAIRLGRTLNGSWHGTPTAGVEDARIVMSDNWTAALLGLDESAASHSVFDKVFFFETSRDDGETIPVSYEADVPGYSPIRERLEAARARERVSTYTVRLEQTATDFGEVDVWFDPVEEVPSVVPDGAGSRYPQLYLTRVEDEAILRAQLREVDGGFEKISGIPAGDYLAEFRAPHQLFRYPGVLERRVTLTIGGEPSELRVPLKGLGSTRITVLRSSGSSYCGPLSGTHVRTGGQEADDFYFPAPPYTIPLLPQGEYTLSIDLDAANAHPLSVREYQVTDVVFTLND